MKLESKFSLGDRVFAIDTSYVKEGLVYKPYWRIKPFTLKIDAILYNGKFQYLTYLGNMLEEDVFATMKEAEKEANNRNIKLGHAVKGLRLVK